MSIRKILLVEDNPQDEALILRALGRVNLTNRIDVVRDGQQARTSSDEERERLKSYEIGANSFVKKPLEFGVFAETVARLGVTWLATNEPPRG